MSFKTVALFGRYQDSGLDAPLKELATMLLEAGIEVIIEHDTAAYTGVIDYPIATHEQIGDQADLAIVMGGDGTVLGVGRSLAEYNVPIIGINHGRLGFITDIPIHNAKKTIKSIIDGQYETEERSMLRATLVRDGVELISAVAFNDVVLNRAGKGGMIELSAHYNDEFMYSLRSDGLIVSTATGSTAYALSAGGPVLHPSLSGFLLVPIAPQTLSHRPIIIPDTGTLTLTLGKLGSEDRQANVHFDMQTWNDLCEGDQVHIKRAKHCVTFVHPIGYSYFSTLRKKLHWNVMPETSSS